MQGHEDHISEDHTSPTCQRPSLHAGSYAPCLNVATAPTESSPGLLPALQVESLLDEATAELGKMEFSPMLSTMEADFKIRKSVPLHTTLKVECEVRGPFAIQALNTLMHGHKHSHAYASTLASTPAMLGLTMAGRVWLNFGTFARRSKRSRACAAGLMAASWT